MSQTIEDPTETSSEEISEALKYVSFTPNADMPKLEDAQQVANYLKSGKIFSFAEGKEDDEIDPTKLFVIPIGSATDGTYIWPLSLEYYVREYGFSFDENFLQHIRGHNYELPDDEAQTVIAAEQIPGMVIPVKPDIEDYEDDEGGDLPQTASGE